MALMYGRIALHLRGDLLLARMMVGDILEQRGLHDDALAQYQTVKGDAALQDRAAAGAPPCWNGWGAAKRRQPARCHGGRAP